ncbi:MAG: hypothetical protein IH588_14815 [Anaerolineales bacterium]|nr:hypothetical protein [Anaerolineales bacterium]
MSMEDILKVLVNSRQQQGNASQSADPMTSLIGSLLGGAQTQGQSHAPVAPPSYYQQQQQMQQQQQTGGLGSMMGLLEMVMGSNQGNTGMPSSLGTNNPVMALLQPYVEKLAKKMNIPPQIAMVVVSFVAYKMLSHHPTSGRDSNSFDLDALLGQMSTGKIDKNIYQTSGMVNEISRSTGLDEATAAKTLDAAFGMFGKQIQKVNAPTTAKPRVTPGARGLRSTGARGSAKVKRG